MTPTFFGEADYRHDEQARIGVLVANLGTPAAPTTAAVRRYLAEFLSDPRVVEAPRALWWLVLHGIILRSRPRRSAAAYAKVWSDEGSPLLAISRRQRDQLEARLERDAPGRIRVALGMRYGEPSIADALAELANAGARRVLVLPLYPQYSATTTGSTFDAVAARLSRTRWLPELRFVTDYHLDPGYIDALAASVSEARERLGAPDRLLFSFHGLPQRYLRAGDPYHCQCHATARRVAAALDLAADQWALSFQSRVGREPWLQPYTDHLLAQWAAAGVGTVHVLCPGFSADCLETLEEIAMQNRDDFLAAGGDRLEYIPALNDRPDHIDALASMVDQRIADWIAGPEPGPPPAERRQRALALGATQ